MCSAALVGSWLPSTYSGGLYIPFVGRPELPHLPLAEYERWEVSFLSTKPHCTFSLPLVVSF